MVLRLYSAFTTTPPSPHVDLTPPRTLSPFETCIFAQNHKFDFWTRYMRQLTGLTILIDAPLMFCLPNDTAVASCGLSSFENTLVFLYICFCLKSQIPFLCRIIATPYCLNIKWFSAFVLPSQRHHPRLMWTCQLREHSRHLRHTFLPKNTNSTFVQDKCDNFCP